MKSNLISKMEKDNEIICDVTSDATDSLNSTKQYGLGVRHIQLALLFMCMASVYVTRVNLSMAIVGMTEMEESDSSIPKFDWGEQTKGMILSSFFWGYLVMNIPAAILTHNFNNKILLSVVMTGNCVLTILTPFIVTNFDYIALVVTRVVQGLLQGFLMPNMHSLMSKWVPPNERSRAGAFVIGGMNFGITLTMFASGYILSTSIGWPLIYYMSGALCVCWLILFITLSANSPDLHKSISAEERDYIKYSLEHRVDDHIKLSIPWKSIFTSKPVWAIVFAHMGQNWGMWTLLTEIPTFFKSALNYNIKSDGELSALPYFLMWIASFPLAFLADQLIRKKYMTLEVSRKFWNNIGQTLNGLFLIAFPFIAQDAKEAAIVVYTIATTLNCCMLFGFNINHMDISPNFSAILMGISNCAANITSILGPLYAGFVVKDEKSISDWRSVFFMSAACYIIGSLIFTIFGSGEVQAWNNPTKQSTSRRNSYFPEQLEDEIKPDMTSVFHSKSTNIGLDVKTRY